MGRQKARERKSGTEKSWNRVIVSRKRSAQEVGEGRKEKNEKRTLACRVNSRA